MARRKKPRLVFYQVDDDGQLADDEHESQNDLHHNVSRVSHQNFRILNNGRLSQSTSYHDALTSPKMRPAQPEYEWNVEPPDNGSDYDAEEKDIMDRAYDWELADQLTKRRRRTPSVSSF